MAEKCIPFGMPDPDVLEPDQPVAGNYQYKDLRGASWSDVMDVLCQDRELSPRLKIATDVDDEIKKYLGARSAVPVVEEDDRDELFWDSVYSYLDPGLASTVLALSAAGAAPVFSCNGGIFGDEHFEKFPLVGFYASEEVGRKIEILACSAGVILEFNRISETPVLSCLEIEPFMRFAELMITEFGTTDETHQ